MRNTKNGNRTFSQVEIFSLPLRSVSPISDGRARIRKWWRHRCCNSSESKIEVSQAGGTPLILIYLLLIASVHDLENRSISWPIHIHPPLSDQVTSSWFTAIFTWRGFAAHTSTTADQDYAVYQEGSNRGHHDMHIPFIFCGLYISL